MGSIKSKPKSTKTFGWADQKLYKLLGGPALQFIHLFLSPPKSVYIFRLYTFGGLNLPLESKFSPPNLEFGWLNLAPKFTPQKGLNS